MPLKKKPTVNTESKQKENNFKMLRTFQESRHNQYVQNIKNISNVQNNNIMFIRPFPWIQN